MSLGLSVSKATIWRVALVSSFKLPELSFTLQEASFWMLWYMPHSVASLNINIYNCNMFMVQAIFYLFKKCLKTCGLYYKHIMIINMSLRLSVSKVTIWRVTLVSSFELSEVSFTLQEASFLCLKYMPQTI
jgi:hypothetical protein